MLVILYIISAVASYCIPTFEYDTDYKNSWRSTAVAIISGILYIIPMIYKIYQNLFTPQFEAIFGLLSLIFWDYAFLSGDEENWFSYIASAFIASIVLCFLFSNFYFSDYLTKCNENHNYTECVELVTTVDGLEDGESIFGDGFVVGKFKSSNSKADFYKYYFQSENGNVKTQSIRVDHTNVVYVDDDVSPYVEISYEIECKGCRNKSKTHLLNIYSRNYTLYIPENSIQTNITPTS